MAKKMARNGRTKFIYKGKFVSIQSLCSEIECTTYHMFGYMDSWISQFFIYPDTWIHGYLDIMDNWIFGYLDISTFLVSG